MMNNDTISNRLHAWALNNEMIDTHFTGHGLDCVSASELLVQQDAEIEQLRGQLQRATSLPTASEAARNVALEAEIERLRATCTEHAEIEQHLSAEIERLRGTQCNWTDEGGDCWETDCGHGFQFNDGGPADNSFTHCPFCGGKLIVVQVDE